MSTIAPTIAPNTVTLRPTTLLEIGLAELESGSYQQCQYALKLGHAGMRCAEGVFAEQLVTAYPETYAWLSDGSLLNRNVGNGATLISLDWMALHPSGDDLANYASRRLGHDTISQANDNGKSFAEIAAAFREGLDALAAARLPHVCPDDESRD